MSNRNRKNRNRQEKNRTKTKLAGVLVGLSVAQAGGCLFPYGSLTTVAQAGQIQTSQTVYAQPVVSAFSIIDLSVDKSALATLIGQAEQTELSGYDASAVAFYKAALTSAKQVSADADATQSMVDKHILLLQAAASALYEKTDSSVVYDGTYQITGKLRHATANQDSMGNAALKKPFQLIKSGKTVTLRMECIPLTTKFGTSNFTGYLAGFWYFPSAKTDDVPTSAKAVAATVESYYNVYDSYNDPKKGTDAQVKGKKYPHYLKVPVELNQSFVWSQVYVPVMEAISTGGGKQYAKLILDWSSLKQVSGQNTDKTALKKAVTSAQTRLAALKKDSDGFAAEQITMLTQAIASGQAADKNLNVSQTTVDAQTTALTRAVDACSRTKVNTDKSQLLKSIKTAETYLKEEDVTYAAEGFALLQQAYAQAQQVYAYQEATQTQVNLCIQAITDAINGLKIEGTDKRALHKALNQAEKIRADKESYTAAVYEVLERAYQDAKTVYANKDADQETADSKTIVLNYVMEHMKTIDESKVDRTGLYNILKIASNLTGKESAYTTASMKKLKTAISNAETVYKNSKATQAQIQTQTEKLSAAVTALVLKTNSSNNSNNNSNKNTNNNSNNNSGKNTNNNSNNNSDKNNDSGTKLNVKKLADGVYSVTGKMLKTDKSTASMSNEAVNHTVKLTVKNGKYTLTLDFKGMKINGQLGYLGKLKYFKSGYTTDKYGTPKGTAAKVSVKSVQKKSDGSKVRDNFGTDYPDQVSFPLISEAKSNGWVPLQVFVPIMDAISSGTGTQPVYLKLDWTTLKKTSADDKKFKDDSKDNDNTGNSGSGNSGSGTSGSGLNTMSGGSSLSGSSKLGNNTLSEGSSLSGSTSQLGSGSSLNGSDTSTTSLQTGTLDGSSDSIVNGTAAGSASGTADGNTNGTTDTSGANTSTAPGSDSQSEQSENFKKMAVPSIISLLAAAIGVLYKLRSRRKVKS